MTRQKGAGGGREGGVNGGGGGSDADGISAY